MDILKRLFFNYWYYRDPPWDTGISPPELIHFIAENPSGRSLDIGCGSGTNAITLAENGWDSTGVDFAPKAIKAAKNKARNAAVDAKFYIDDAIYLKHIEGKFDLVLDMGCFHNLSDKKKLLYMNNLPKILKKGGAFMIYAFQIPDAMTGSGLNENDISKLSTLLTLVDRTNGFEREDRPSVWLEFLR